METNEVMEAILRAGGIRFADALAAGDDDAAAEWATMTALAVAEFEHLRARAEEMEPRAFLDYALGAARKIRAILPTVPRDEALMMTPYLIVVWEASRPVLEAEGWWPAIPIDEAGWGACELYCACVLEEDQRPVIETLRTVFGDVLAEAVDDPLVSEGARAALERVERLAELYPDP